MPDALPLPPLAGDFAFAPGDRIQASGAVQYSTGRDHGGMYQIREGEYPSILFGADGMWTCYRYVDFSKAPGSVTISVKSGQPGGVLQVRKDAPDGPVIATLDVPDTGWKWKERTVPVYTDPSGKEDVYLVAAKAPFSVKYFRFNP